MPSPQMIACRLSMPHKARMGLTGLKKYGRKLKDMKMMGMGAYKKDVMTASGHGQMRTLKFR